MPDTLRELGRNLGRTARDAEFLKRRGGGLPQIDRTRGLLSNDISFISNFSVNEPSRKMGLTISFYLNAVS